jgi:ATP-dependent DNA helicase 2 subunit 2
MADKEATVYIVDLGSTMGKRGSGRDISNLDFTMKYVWDRISTTVAASRKTWTVGVLGLRTDKTDNSQDEEEGYENISVLQALGPMTMTSLKDLQQHIRPNKTTNGDAISAIVVAIDMIDIFTKKLKYKRRVILVTDGLGAMDADDIDDISSKANESNIELIVMCVMLCSFRGWPSYDLTVQ